ncbi:hypothetical protein BMETH_1671_0 [methanotrophic bacterial endosymbiont of Bathymodiolus sp.]|nr:hypothetical protein BMETH_1671_0 [methanotrophic bacterial endosymbiont of Bathymodiolus sp.]
MGSFKTLKFSNRTFYHGLILFLKNTRCVTQKSVK